MLRGLYDWVLHWAATPYGTWALFLLALSESSFFPIPPDVLLIALAVAIPERSFKYAGICSIGSVLGGFGTSLLVNWIGVENLLLVMAGTMLIAFGLGRALVVHHVLEVFPSPTPVPLRGAILLAGY